MTAAQARPLVVVVLAAVAMVTVGCSSGSKSSSAGTSTSTSTPTSASPTTSSVGPTSTSAGSSTTGAPTSTTPPSNRCHTSQLDAGVGPSQGATGSSYIPITLDNRSSTTCVIEGYAGVSLLDGQGHQIGVPTTRAPGAATAVTLRPGALATITVHTLNAGVASGGCWATSRSVKIYPPDELDALTKDGAITICGNTFTVTPVTAGGSV